MKEVVFGKRSEKRERVTERGDDQIREVLLERGLWKACTIPPRASILEALACMEDNNVGALVVTGEEGVAGVISERDCARQVLLAGKDPGRTTVDDVMSRGICSVTPSKEVSECIELMLRRRIRHLPVLFGRYLVGCVSLRNLLEYQYRVKPEPGAKVHHEAPPVATKRSEGG